MDQHKLRTLVFEKTGVRIDIDDPVFAVVALNEAVLAEAVERHVAMIDRASEAMAARLGVAGVAGVLDMAPVPAAPATAPAAAAAVSGGARGIGVAAGAAVLGAGLVLAGQALWFKPPAPAPLIQARELSAEQSAALRQAEKLDKIVQKLDSKTRAAIRAEMQKP